MTSLPRTKFTRSNSIHVSWMGETNNEVNICPNIDITRLSVNFEGFIAGIQEGATFYPKEGNNSSSKSNQESGVVRELMCVTRKTQHVSTRHSDAWECVS